MELWRAEYGWTGSVAGASSEGQASWTSCTCSSDILSISADNQHKHSLSHNFFSFLDPTVTNPALAPSSPVPRLPSPSTKSTQFPTSVPIPLQSSTSLLGSASIEASSPNRRIDPHTQLYLSVAVIQFLIGAGLWIEGQLSGWRCLAGVGYLSVFDAAGVAIRMTRENDGSRSTRRPYG